MPDKTSVDRIRQNLQTARQAVDTLSSTLDSLEGELPVCRLGRQTLRIPTKQLQEMVEGENRPSGEKPGKTRS